MEREVDGRIAWIDLAKAACILLVVLYHVVMAFPTHPGWEALSAALRPLRMPLFFLASGLLAAPLLDRPWEAGARRRLLLLVHVYVIWALVCAFSRYALPGDDGAHPGDLLLAVAAGRSEIWYLWALAVFLAVAYATRRLPWWVPLGAAAALSLASRFPVDPAHDSMLRCLPFFLAGIRLRDAALAFAAAASMRRLLLWGGLLAALVALSHAVPGLPPLPSDTAAVLFGVTAASLAARRWPAAAKGGAWLGARTLPVYVLHFPLVGAAAAGAALASPALFTGAAAEIVAPALLLPIAVGAALLLHRRLVAAGLSWLFAPPPPPQSMKSPLVSA